MQDDWASTSREICAICSKTSGFRCSRCSEVGYCSQECQIVDHSLHKLLCSKPYPPSNRRRARVLVFPEEGPALWKNIRTDRWKEELSTLISPTSAGLDYLPIWDNFQRQRMIPEGGREQGEAPDSAKHFSVWFRNDCHRDQSAQANLSFYEWGGARPELEPLFRGPIVVIGWKCHNETKQEAQNITLTDIRDIADGIAFAMWRFKLPQGIEPVLYGTQAMIGQGKAMAKGVKVHHGDDTSYRAIDVPLYQSVFVHSSFASALSKRIQLPIQGFIYPVSKRLKETTDLTNDVASALFVDLNTQSITFGQINSIWSEPGTVALFRSDGKPLTPQVVEALCHWCLDFLRPLLEYLSEGADCYDRAWKEEWLSAVTSEDFLAFFDKFVDGKKAEGLEEWENVQSPYDA